MDFKSSISNLPGVGPILSRKLEKLNITTVEDLFYHVPSRYVDYSQVTTINKLKIGETVTIHAKIISITNVFSKRGLRMQIGSVEDSTGKVGVVWFNQQFLTRMLYPGRLVSLSGKVGFFNKKVSLTSPDYEILEDENDETMHTGRLVPIYPETSGLSSKWIRTLIKRSFSNLEIKEFLPNPKINLKDAIEFVHFPKNLEETEIGRNRLAFNELLFMNLKSVYRKVKWKRNKVVNKLTINKLAVNKFIDALPFKLTNSQEKAIEEILNDLSKDVPMNRLLEGDVGSGKTIVAAIGMFVVGQNKLKSIIMAPTQILAEQHFKTISKLFKNVELITSNSKKINEDADVFVGTHALIHSKVDFTKVAFIVIDEQHRFGVEQRQHLVKKSKSPHVLTMTATPIPRTIALTSYGDLELSTLTEMPLGRQKVTTWLVPPQKRLNSYDWIEKHVTGDGSQVFWVCPLINESDKETMEGVKAATQEFDNLKLKIKNVKFGLLHGKLKPAEKNKVLDKFRAGKTDILVTTPVVEVGIDIPNATIMVIEAAERFGLAQLHQLRGRVGRSDKKSYCLLFGKVNSRRLKAMTKMHSGFELAELDLKMRGPGDVFGTKQSGFPELKAASWSDYEMIKETKDLAEDVFKNPKKFTVLLKLLNLDKISF